MKSLDPKPQDTPQNSPDNNRDAAQSSALVQQSPAAASQRARFSLRSLMQGDLGFIPVLLTLALITIYFQLTTSGVFLQARNLSNLTQQIVAIGILSIAAVLVLLLGEIDLSLAAVAQACAAIMATVSVYQNWNPWLAMLVALLSGAVIGLLNGLFIAVLRVPSFIVTLAGSIAYAGLLLVVMGPQTTLVVRDPTIRALAPTYLPPALGWGIPLVCLALYAAGVWYNQRRRSQVGLPIKHPTQLVLQLLAATVVVLILMFLFHSYQGVPQAVMIALGLVVIFWLVLRKTPFGRHLYAVGGNAEAARRAGINVVRMKLTVFILASTLAAFAGIMMTSRSTAVATQISSTLLLNAIAAAVIGGVSLFGGRGSVWAVVLGALVIGSLDNGLDLLNQDQGVKNIVQGAVLVLAVTADAVVRRAGFSRGK
ncbi:inner-membrane translocator [Leptolyngbya sp. NK1-12]|uniref:Xylose transport system permease protein XylH n=1 Tax=Leptolyngbya sp. NK1-12 TaxID=2547451 RepID=A0AA96WLH4_9CYAN|nr:inner-membrane translocator [Leptolyngbya sp. NK1-12]MBF2047979.1 inner-membrane translocator [Elainella sp. C42_A2020_010]RNJ65329.1 MAG: inner-membrane translocator [Leptolyngbya sp. IPPAS B-1204]WNZ27349.1 inner-membrane translocator [Leptolyngbya sp. NK1-12]